MAVRELLGLLPTFDAIYSELNLSRAAHRLGVSQSSVSQSLARLRQLTGDALFVTNGRGVRPTPRADAVITHVRAALTEADQVINRPLVSIEQLERAFVIAVRSGLDSLLAPRIFREAVARAPGVKLVFTVMHAGDPQQELRSGNIDLVLDTRAALEPGMRTQRILTSPCVMISSRKRAAITETEFAVAKHASVGWMDQVRSIGPVVATTVVVPTLAALGAVVASSDLLAIIPQVGAEQLAEWFALAVHAVPRMSNALEVHQNWHERSEKDEAHVWLRSTVSKACATQP